MRLLILIAACLAVASASSLHFRAPADRFNEQWEMFKTAHKKTYPSKEDEMLRRFVWEQNMRFIQKHNFEADLGRHTFRVGMNEYGDLTNAEYRHFLLGYRFNASRKSQGSTFLPPSNVVLPDTVDWRTKGYVTPVKNQGQCGSCWSFSTTGSLEGQHFRRTGNLVSLSEQNLVDCSQMFGNQGCNGGWPQVAFAYIAENGGIDTEASYPYKAKNMKCRFKSQNVGATDYGFVEITRDSEDNLQWATATVGPISVAIDAAHKSFQFYRSGVYVEPKCSSYLLDHAVLVVGYGTENGKDYWLVKNSWGGSWGLSGYIKMARNMNNQCGIATAASFPLA